MQAPAFTNPNKNLSAFQYQAPGLCHNYALQHLIITH